MTDQRQDTDAGAAQPGPDLTKLMLQRYGEEAQVRLVETVELRGEIERLNHNLGRYVEAHGKVSAELAAAKAKLARSEGNRGALAKALVKVLPHLPARQAAAAKKLLDFK